MMGSAPSIHLYSEKNITIQTKFYFQILLFMKLLRMENRKPNVEFRFVL